MSHMNINHQPLKKHNGVKLFLKVKIDFMRYFLKTNLLIQDLKIRKMLLNTKVIRKSPKKYQVKNNLALLCVKRWMLLLNLHSFRLSQKSTSSGNYSRVRFWTCLSRLRRPLGGARLFCDVAELVAGIHCRWLREQECSLINVPLGGNFHASSYPIDPPSSCEFAMLEFCGGYCKKKAKRETYFCR